MHVKAANTGAPEHSYENALLCRLEYQSAANILLDNAAAHIFIQRCLHSSVDRCLHAFIACMVACLIGDHAVTSIREVFWLAGVALALLARSQG